MLRVTLVSIKIITF